MTWLITLFLGCIGMTWFNPDECVVYLNQIMEVEEQPRLIRHLWYSEDSYIQDVVEYAYMLWGIDFVTLLECENWRRTLDWVWDNWHAHWLCMVNDRWHKIPSDFYDHYKIQVDYCYNLYVNHTKFYGPNRNIHWVKCKDYVLSRFEINNG